MKLTKLNIILTSIILLTSFSFSGCGSSDSAHQEIKYDFWEYLTTKDSTHSYDKIRTDENGTAISTQLNDETENYSHENNKFIIIAKQQRNKKA